MASLVNTKTYEASARMYGIFAPRSKGEGQELVTGNFFVRVPSYSEVSKDWRDRVLSGTDVLFEGLSKDTNTRNWTVNEASHDMFTYRTPAGMSFRDAVELIVKNVPKALEKLGLGAESNPLLGERFVRSFERLLEDCDIASAKPDGEKDARIIVTDILSRIGLIFQAPFIISDITNQESPLETLHDKLFSADFGKDLGTYRDLGLVQAHVFGVSPFVIRGTDMMAFKNGEKNPMGRGVEIKIGWDALLNSRPAMDALMDILVSGKFFGPDINVPAEIVKKFTGKSGYTGDPNGIRSLSGETLFIRIPDAVRNKEKPALGGEKVFVSILHAVLKPYLNMALAPNGFEKFIIPEDKLPEEYRNIPGNVRNAINIKANVYEAHAIQERAAKEEQSKKTESGMDTSPRIVPYPGKSQVYMLFPTDRNTAAIKGAVNEFVASDQSMNPVEWRENNKYKYTYAYVTGNQESQAKPLSTLEGRIIASKKLNKFISEKAGIDIPVTMPNELNLTLRVGGQAGKKGETYIFVEVPGSSDRDIRKAAKSGEHVMSDESKFLLDVKKILTEKTSDEDDVYVVNGAGEMALINSEDSKTVFGINVTSMAKERETLDKAVEAVKKAVETDVLAVAAEKHPDVSIGITVRYTKDERAREREKELKQNLAAWKTFEDKDTPAADSPDYDLDNMLPDDSIMQGGIDGLGF